MPGWFPLPDSECCAGDDVGPEHEHRQEKDQAETLFGEPFAVVQGATILEVTSEKRTMERCIERILAGVLFKPPPGDRVQVNIPMNFRTVKTQTALNR